MSTVFAADETKSGKRATRKRVRSSTSGGRCAAAATASLLSSSSGDPTSLATAISPLPSSPSSPRTRALICLQRTVSNQQLQCSQTISDVPGHWLEGNKPPPPPPKTLAPQHGFLKIFFRTAQPLLVSPPP